MQHVTIYTAKLDESVKFYQEIVGLKIRNQMNGPKKIVFLTAEEGGTAVELIENPDEAFQGSGISIGFKVQDVEKRHEELKEQGIPVSPIISPVPVVKFFFVTDPNGLKVQLI